MSRFYIPKEAVKGETIVITGPEAHHIIDVMRLKRLDKVVAFDGTGAEFIGFIKDVKKKAVLMKVVETRLPPRISKSKITLIQSIPKKDKMDYVVEKATELGVHSIMPIVTARTIVRWSCEKKALAVDRWRRIAKEASKQCGRADIADIQEIRDYDYIIRSFTDYDIVLIATLAGDTLQLKDALKDFKGGRIAVLIGPEGDFTHDEVAMAREAFFKPVTLGSRVLKSDTAALAALAVLNYEFADR